MKGRKQNLQRSPGKSVRAPSLGNDKRNQFSLQRDLALELAKASSLHEALSLTIHAVVQTSGSDSAGIYLRNNATGRLELAMSIGPSEELYKRITQADDAPETPLYTSINESLPFRDALATEGIRSVAVIPVLHLGRFIACFNGGVCQADALPASTRSMLELMGVNLSIVIGRLRAQQELQEELSRVKRVEESFDAKTQSLEEMNAALKVLLNGREKDNHELTGKVLSNVEHLIQPYVTKLKNSKLDITQAVWIDIVETNLREITSPFLRNLNAANFTPREIEIIQLLKEGRTSKAIADLLNISFQGVEIHRHRIRKKLGLNNKKTNLQAHLFSLV